MRQAALMVLRHNGMGFEDESCRARVGGTFAGCSSRGCLGCSCSGSFASFFPRPPQWSPRLYCKRRLLCGQAQGAFFVTRTPKVSVAFNSSWSWKSRRFSGADPPILRGVFMVIGITKYTANHWELRNPVRLAWDNGTPVGCGVQPKRLVKVRERAGAWLRWLRPKDEQARQQFGASFVRGVTETGTNQAVFRQRQVQKHSKRYPIR
jgi:hypothetical protein